MSDFEKQQGISFIILYFSSRDEFYFVPFCDIINFWNRGKNGGRKSFTYDEIDKSYRIHASKGVPVHYLDALQKDIMSRD